MDNAGFCNETYESLHNPASDDELVDVAGATLDFSSTEDVPPLDPEYGSGTRLHYRGERTRRYEMTLGESLLCLFVSYNCLYVGSSRVGLIQDMTVVYRDYFDKLSPSCSCMILHSF